MWNRVDVVRKTYIPVGNFDSKGDVGIVVGFDERSKRLRSSAGGFYFNRHDVVF